jgi:hypothetical protein
MTAAMAVEASLPAPSGLAASAGSPGLLIAGAVALLALPSVVLGFTLRLDSPAGPGSFAGEALNAPVAPPSGLARAGLSLGTLASQFFRFTPAGLAAHPNREVTVAVRVDAETAHAIIVRARPALATGQPPLAAFHLAPSAYSLAATHVTLPAGRGLAADLRRIDMPDLSTFGRDDSAAPGAQPRLFPRIALDASERAGRSARTLESLGTQTLEAGGSYRLSRNLDVTAGVRYQRDRDRLQASADGKADTQAVFVGTQFRF